MHSGAKRGSVDWSSRRPPVQHLPHDLYYFSLFHSEDIGRQSWRLKAPECKTASSFDQYANTGQRLHESLGRLVRGPAVCSDKIVSHDVSHGDSLCVRARQEKRAAVAIARHPQPITIMDKGRPRARVWLGGKQLGQWTRFVRMLWVVLTNKWSSPYEARSVVGRLVLPAPGAGVPLSFSADSLENSVSRLGGLRRGAVSSDR